MSGASGSDNPTRTYEVQAAILLFLNLVAAAFSGTMLSWAIRELAREGEQWGLVGVMFFGGIGFVVQLALLAWTIVLMKPARALSAQFRMILLVPIVAAVLADAAALGCVFYQPFAHRAAFARTNPVYQSGLRQAVLRHNVKRAREILEANPGLMRETDYEGRNALLLAVGAHDSTMVAMLLEHGAEAGQPHFSGTTALQIAARDNELEIAQMLLDHGARVNDADRDGKTALAHAREAGHKAMVELLAGRGGTDADHEASLVDAVQAGDIGKAATLLNRGLNVNTCVPNGQCLLDFAAETGNLEMARFLIARGASVKRVDRNRRTALHWASGKGNTAMAGFLIDQGADADARDYEGMTPLHSAVYWAQWHEAPSLETIKVLAGKGADVNARNQEGVTPLKYAQKYGTDAIREFLRGCGASE